MVYLIPIGVIHYHLGYIKVKFRVLHGWKNDQSLCNIVMGILSLKIGLMEFYFLVPRVLHSKSVNAIPSSCIYELSQIFNYEIGGFFLQWGYCTKSCL